MERFNKDGIGITGLKETEQSFVFTSIDSARYSRVLATVKNLV